MKNYFNLLFSVILLILFSCREEILESQNATAHDHEKTSYLKHHTQYSDFVAQTNLNFSNALSSELKGNNTLILDTIITNNFFVNVEDITFTANKNNQPTSYSFYIASKKSKIDIFHNLVFMKKKGGEWIYRLLKYTRNGNSKPNHFQGSIQELFDSEKKAKNIPSGKVACYYQILTSVGTCSYGHKTISDCGGNVNCCANCWTVYQTAMLNCDHEGLEYPDDGGGFPINDGGGFQPGGFVSLVLALDANYRTKFYTLSEEVKLYLMQNYQSNLDISFSNWSIDFFVQNPTTTLAQFQNWFIDNPILDNTLQNELFEDWADPIRVKPTTRFKNHVKINSIYNQIKSASNFKQYLQNFEPTFSVAHLMFDLDATQNPNALAETSWPTNYWIEITFNKNKDWSNIPKIVIADTFMHEMIHAEIFRKLLSLVSNSNGTLDENLIKQYVSTHNYPGLFDYYVRKVQGDESW